MKKRRTSILKFETHRLVEHEIRIEHGLLKRIAREQKENNRKYIIITDNTVKQLYGEELLLQFKASGLQSSMLSIPPGEENKNAKTYLELVEHILGNGVERSACIIALGGGVVGDMAGFVAATLLRGVPYIQVPTTLVAQVDSSIGGKVGLDFLGKKNLVGQFYQPEGVYIDPAVLMSLPEREMKNGISEIVKYGVIRDEELFGLLENNVDAIRSREPRILEEIIFRCCRIKRDIVQADERETDLRRILNFGHTLGHALESASQFQLNHGEATAVGQVFAAHLAHEQHILATKELNRIIKLIGGFELPTQIPKALSGDQLMALMRTDKKVRNNKLVFVLPERIGHVRITDHVPEETILNVIEERKCSVDR